MDKQIIYVRACVYVCVCARMCICVCARAHACIYMCMSVFKYNLKSMKVDRYDGRGISTVDMSPQWTRTCNVDSCMKICLMLS